MKDIIDDPRREFIKKTVEAGGWGALAASGMMAPLVHAFGQVPKQLPEGRSIYDIKGKVTVDGQKANKYTRVKASSLVKTESNSYVIFAVGKDAHILRENSEMQLEGSDWFEEGLRLLTGKALSVFGSRPQGKIHTMRTTTATIGIRGTGVYAESEGDHSYVCTCYGRVQINANKDNSSEEIVSKHHDAPRYILEETDGGSGLIVPAPMKNHDDEELMLVEAIVGRETPFSGIRSYTKPRKAY